jgi:hypothetical protein
VVFATQSLADIDTSTIASTTEAVEGARRLRLTGCLRGREQ